MKSIKCILDLLKNAKSNADVKGAFYIFSHPNKTRLRNKGVVHTVHIEESMDCFIQKSRRTQLAASKSKSPKATYLAIVLRNYSLCYALRRNGFLQRGIEFIFFCSSNHV
ncbi:hypothetical protein V6N12_020794 [Hibiscus sabdariffa]|uniref:Uncharacterized protein n=1 Tax=Hibiscus sabdariffa TaxID=183260 RepID=A0ABR2CZ66_9ROSI